VGRRAKIGGPLVMSMSNPNAAAALALVQELYLLGVGGVCISPGSRSSALVLAVLKTPALKPWVILDERSAAYFALGAARETGRPTLVICTSGTAVANCLPAIVEASLAHVPLIVVSADRPPELQDCHAPQTIDQRQLFGHHVRSCIELPAPGGREPEEYYRTIAFRAVDAALGMPPGPVHINFPMREPLIDVEEERAALVALTAAHRLPDLSSSNSGTGLKWNPIPADERSGDTNLRPVNSAAPRVVLHRVVVRPARSALDALRSKLKAHRRGVILCGPGLNERTNALEASEAICELARRLDWPILADPLSGLRFGCRDLSRIVDTYDVLLRDPALCGALFPEAVLQFGRPLTSKAAGAFFAAPNRPPFCLVAAPWGSWPDPGRGATDAIRADAGELARALCEGVEPAPARWSARWLISARAAREYLNRALASEAAMPVNECALFPLLLRILPEGAALHVGNSMPVRDLDTFGERSPRRLDVFCNRGANGIDGVLSAAAGADAMSTRPTVVVLGDLSFLHDLGALKAAVAHARHLTVIVINNNGGGIFSFLPQAELGDVFETYFVAPHGLEGLESAARLYGASYRLARSMSELERASVDALTETGRLHVIEIQTDRVQNVALHRSLLEGALKAARAALPAASQGS
jgi:2-succinyl-5-enolpyruvyl-6-hydroxy-3-cyclohexene-1-carboxylate synthase